jgi:hypothetical protein
MAATWNRKALPFLLSLQLTITSAPELVAQDQQAARRPPRAIQDKAQRHQFISVDGRALGSRAMV